MESLALDTEEQFTQFQKILAYDDNIVTLNPKTFLSAVEHSKGSSIMVRVDLLKAMENFNPRIDTPKLAAHIRSIATSIREEGFMEDKPLAGIASLDGKTPRILVTDGHCRLKALHIAIAEGAEISLVPVVLKDRTTTQEDLLFAMVRSNDDTRKFTPLELSIILKRLYRYKFSEKAIAARMGISEEYVTQLLTIAGAPATIREMIAQGEVPIAVALQSIRTHGVQAGSVLQEAVTQAKAKGQSKITRKDLPQQVYKKKLTKNAPVMVAIIQQVYSNQAFAALPPELQGLINKVVAELAQAKATPAPDEATV